MAQHRMTLTRPEEQFMRALSRVIAALPRALDGDLVREQRLSLTEYFALTYLAEAEDHRLRVSELARRLSLSLSGATRTVNRLEPMGLVARERSESDGRGSDVVLTAEGSQRLKAAWPSHMASARRHVLDQLDGEDLGRLTRLLERIAPEGSID